MERLGVRSVSRLYAGVLVLLFPHLIVVLTADYGGLSGKRFRIREILFSTKAPSFKSCGNAGLARFPEWGGGARHFSHRKSRQEIIDTSILLQSSYLPTYIIPQQFLSGTVQPPRLIPSRLGARPPCPPVATPMCGSYAGEDRLQSTG